MTDIFSKTKRSEIMSAIKSKGSRIENLFARLLRKNGVRISSHSRSLPGNPDFFSKKKQIVIFIDSCYWHGCRYHSSQPKSNRSFWKDKILKNKLRDWHVNMQYRKMKWKVFRIWEHSLVKDVPDPKTSMLLNFLKK
jgi:DNA mismatch endonuclease (patch repair protein)